MPPSVKAKYLRRMQKFVGMGFMKKVIAMQKAKKAELESKCAEDAIAPLTGGPTCDAEVLEAQPSPPPPVPPPLPPPPLPPPPANEFHIGAKVRVFSDAYGKHACGVVGNVHSFVEDNVVLTTDTMKQINVAVSAVELWEPLKHPRVAKNLKHITGALRGEWLVQCGWDAEVKVGDDAYEPWRTRIAGNAPVLLEATHVQMYSLFLKWSLDLDAKYVFVDPLLLYLYAEMEEEDAEKAAMRWSCIEKQCFSGDPSAVVLLPIVHSEHWVLLVLDLQNKQCRYYDSLLVESESCYLRADFLLESLRKSGKAEWLPAALPHRCNAVRQGPLECGFFVLWWMEDECRRRLGEGRCSKGWPRPGDVRANMCKLFANMQAAATKMQKDLEVVLDASKPIVESSAASSSGLDVEELKRLKDIASKDFVAGEKSGFTEVRLDAEIDLGVESWAQGILELNMLLPAHHADVERVKSTMPGICSSCRWSYGCHRCLWWKTVRYWRNKETKGAFMEAYSDSVKAKAKAKLSKAKGGGSEEACKAFAVVDPDVIVGFGFIIHSTAAGQFARASKKKCVCVCVCVCAFALVGGHNCSATYNMPLL